ncbi:MAG: hypothetical protein ACKVOU_02235 [Cytophagales bacterium]
MENAILAFLVTVFIVLLYIETNIMLITIVPTAENHVIELPKGLYGKEIEVEIREKTAKGKPLPPFAKSIETKILLKHFGNMPDFPTIEELRKQTAPNKW